MASILAPLAYFWSYALLSHYVGGDQAHYYVFYKALQGAGIEEISHLAARHLASREPLSAFILWVGATLEIEKNIYISFLNVILIVSIFILAQRHRVRPLLTGLLLTNFYVIVLMTAAERLKIAYIFLIIGALYAGKIRWLFLSSSLFAHLQNGILLTGVVGAYLSNFLKALIFRRSFSTRTSLALISIVAIAAASAYIVRDGLENKIYAYTLGEVSLSELFKVGVLSTIALYVSQKKFRMLCALIPTIVAIAILGGMRVNMIAVTLVIYYLMEERRLDHPLIYLLLAYFSLKTLPFVNKIILYGNGFVD